jgi:pyruvate,water dikinase
VDPDGDALLIPLPSLEPRHAGAVGAKATKLAQLARAGFRVPRGFAITTRAYEAFIHEAAIVDAIRMELGRKSMDDMRWEEIWDAALRIRTLFVGHALSDSLRDAISRALEALDAGRALAVRSSAIGEDSAGRSFAGLHESVVDVRGAAAVEDAVRRVWASLWSDGALLYRRELGLDAARSRMAVLVQEMVEAEPSGVAFGRDPRDPGRPRAIVEAVPGPCRLLVDGLVDPDRWELDRETRQVQVWRAGERGGCPDATPLLEARDLDGILGTLLAVERLFDWPADLEWTGRTERFTVLQARPITRAKVDDGDERTWYLSLRPGDAQLGALRERVAGQLIPELEALGQALADEPLDALDDQALAGAIDRRRELLAHWMRVYWDEFIPFAHGVRRLATYYTDAVRPSDPYEFVDLLRDQELLADRRNRAIEGLARRLAGDPRLREAVERLIAGHGADVSWDGLRASLTSASERGEGLMVEIEHLRKRYLDITYDGARLDEDLEGFLHNLLEMAGGAASTPHDRGDHGSRAEVLEARLLEAVGPERRIEAREVLATGRLSWKLRDDDNLLVARLQSQLLRAVEAGAQRLRARGRLTGSVTAREAHAEPVARALRTASTVALPAAEPPEPSTPAISGDAPRQLVGQPASPGLATGAARCVQGRDDLGRFRRGEVLVCDAIQPTMTHLVPLASAIVERRGGMLIHGAIIARELGIPCVNGVRGAADVLSDGDLLTVDGHLGIVTVGAPEFDLELAPEKA